eukprot:547127-Pyramimonas_sp.AAC.1
MEVRTRAGSAGARCLVCLRSRSSSAPRAPERFLVGEGAHSLCRVADDGKESSRATRVVEDDQRRGSMLPNTFQMSIPCVKHV